MPYRQPITYADARSDLPQSDFAKRLAELRIARTFEAANTNERAQPVLGLTHAQERSMVEQERPHPAPRPSPSIAADVDAAVFNARWDTEHRRAAPQPSKGDQTMSDDKNAPNRPAETLREGSLKAAIWRNESEHGAYHSVTLARTYKDQEGNLHDTPSFRAKDMLGLSELARRAHHHTHDLDREAFKEQRQAQEQQPPAQSQGHSR
jgi:hypothetical protein